MTDPTAEIAELRRLLNELERLTVIADAAVEYADKQECVACGQHRVYTHLPRCPVARHKQGKIKEAGNE
jgi:hypothetical protein